MKYYVRLGASTHEVFVDSGKVLVDGVELAVDLARVPGTPIYHLLAGGKSWIVAAQELETPGNWILGVAGERLEVSAVDERTRELESLAGAVEARSGAASVRAPMPGLVVRIEATEGQRVEAGAALVVVEAMKMENELRAPHAALVRTVHVAVGQAVERGTVLVTLDG
jgi:biotin carboxyl carrier protein